MNGLKTRILLAAFLLISLGAASQEKSVVIDSSNDTLLIGNYLILTITLNNIESSLNSHQFDDFKITCGPNFTSTYQNINGEVTKNKKYIYHLEALEEGVFTIPAIEIESEGHAYFSNDQTITILPNPEGIVSPPEIKGESSFFNWSTPNTPAPPSAPIKVDPLKKKRKKI